MCLGIPGQIVEVTDATRMMAMAEISGVRREVNVACIAGGDIADVVGKWALIHVGFAMSEIDEEEAAKTLEALRGLGEAQETLEAIAAGDAALGQLTGDIHRAVDDADDHHPLVDEVVGLGGVDVAVRVQLGAVEAAGEGRVGPARGPVMAVGDDDRAGLGDLAVVDDGSLFTLLGLHHKRESLGAKLCPLLLLGVHYGALNTDA